MLTLVKLTDILSVLELLPEVKTGALSSKTIPFYPSAADFGSMSFVPLTFQEPVANFVLNSVLFTMLSGRLPKNLWVRSCRLISYLTNSSQTCFALGFFYGKLTKPFVIWTMALRKVC